jgi:hypothetical protein
MASADVIAFHNDDDGNSYSSGVFIYELIPSVPIAFADALAVSFLLHVVILPGFKRRWEQFEENGDESKEQCPLHFFNTVRD